MKQTEHCSLNQWELSDPIRMEDFNADNAKIAAELAELRRIVTGLCYHVGQLSTIDMVNRHIAFNPQAVLYEAFIGPEYLTLSEGVTLGDHRLILTGKNAAGTAKVRYLLLHKNPNSTNIHCWLHHKGGNVSITMNGIEMAPTDTYRDLAAGLGITCTCEEFHWTGPSAIVLDVTLDLNCGDDASMEVYDLYMAFL